jgi:hypothetical protein
VLFRNALAELSTAVSSNVVRDTVKETDIMQLFKQLKTNESNSNTVQASQAIIAAILAALSSDNKAETDIL